jgi:hypothetical protein
MFKSIVVELEKEYGEKTVSEVLNNPSNTKIEIAQAAAIIKAFYQKVIALNEERAAQLMRVTFKLN